ncbi:hypothetical protein [Thiomicrorhabdus sediminis]|uniref:Uncharacterized protein n=1 Tax=Thiomicrorhabdus sediminis TaxID=2580412 RepID=A0A4P9K4R0_9GAMM|nr:hypothetical protein [Thiomicrorhabdus sediminis]QCU89955.1 hypothetical protein FE785_04555 [Thiomicrorhabdus sediminis]
MTNLMILLAAVFLPLFPMSMLFNAIMAKISQPYLRMALFVIWPQIGLLILASSQIDIPEWIIIWAAATAMFYAFRLTVIRDVGLWTSFLATSTWALLWIFSASAMAEQAIYIALTMSIPLVVLTLLAHALVTRYGAAYAGLFGGLAQNMPRFAGVLVITVLAATATPGFPNFFMMIKASVLSTPLLMVMLGLTWLLWSWSAARFIQGMIVGTEPENKQPDISLQATWLYAVVLVVLALAGSFFIGGLL